MKNLRRTMIASAVSIAISSNSNIAIANDCAIDAGNNSYISSNGICNLSDLTNQSSSGGRIIRNGIDTTTTTFGTVNIITGINLNSNSIGDNYLSIISESTYKYLIDVPLSKNLSANGNIFLKKQMTQATQAASFTL